jgi:hypothetical protein
MTSNQPAVAWAISSMGVPVRAAAWRYKVVDAGVLDHRRQHRAPELRDGFGNGDDGLPDQ